MGVREKLDALKGITEEQQEYGTEVLRDLGILYDDGTIEGVNDNIPRMVARIDDSQTSSEYVWSSQKTQYELTNVAANASSALSTAISTEVSNRNSAINTAVGDEATARSESINEITELIPSNASTTNKLSTAADTAGEEIAGTATGTSITLTDSADGYVQSVNTKGKSWTTNNLIDGIKSVGDDGFEIETTGKNLFDETKYQHIITGYDEQTTYYNVCRIPLKPNTTYTVSQRAGIAVTEPIVMMNNVVNVNTVEGRLDLRNESGSTTLTTDNTGNLYIGAINNMGYTDELAYARIQACKIQIEESSTATTYEPYKSSTAIIATGLPLRSTLDGVTYDELDSTAGKVITRCEVVNDEIVAKATPTETPLASAEKSALASLRTYDHITHIDATDSPTMTVDYLLNTDNGKAVANVENKIMMLLSLNAGV